MSDFSPGYSATKWKNLRVNCLFSTGAKRKGRKKGKEGGMEGETGRQGHREGGRRAKGREGIRFCIELPLIIFTNPLFFQF